MWEKKAYREIEGRGILGVVFSCGLFSVFGYPTSVRRAAMATQPSFS